MINSNYTISRENKRTINKNRSKNRKGIMKLILANTIILSLVLSIIPNNIVSAAQQNGLPGVIHQSSCSQTLTSGAIHKSITKFTTEGWLNINVLQVDITNPYVKLNSIINNESIQKLTSVPSLALSAKAVGAINAGFFNWSKIPGLNSPIGPIVDDGNIVTSSSDFNRYSDSMATFSIDNVNEVFYEYWKTD